MSKERTPIQGLLEGDRVKLRASGDDRGSGREDTERRWRFTHVGARAADGTALVSETPRRASSHPLPGCSRRWKTGESHGFGIPRARIPIRAPSNDQRLGVRLSVRDPGCGERARDRAVAEVIGSPSRTARTRSASPVDSSHVHLPRVGGGPSLRHSRSAHLCLARADSTRDHAIARLGACRTIRARALMRSASAPRASALHDDHSRNDAEDIARRRPAQGHGHTAEGPRTVNVTGDVRYVQLRGAGAAATRRRRCASDWARRCSDLAWATARSQGGPRTRARARIGQRGGPAASFGITLGTAGRGSRSAAARWGCRIEYPVMAPGPRTGPCPPSALVGELLRLGFSPAQLAGVSQDHEGTHRGARPAANSGKRPPLFAATRILEPVCNAC